MSFGPWHKDYLLRIATLGDPLLQLHTDMMPRYQTRPSPALAHGHDANEQISFYGNKDEKLYAEASNAAAILRL